MKKLLLLASICSLSFAFSQNVFFFKENKNNQLICKTAFATYKIVSQKNAKAVMFNNSSYFQLNNENKYLLSTHCQKIKKN
ncbi:MAG: hypothetical protein GQ570_07325 [Helicobacteraceae bacterium]|nr:hypothetical protein [Helicobacteraceae bacterium]